MILEDLEYIFKKQIDAGIFSLYFMIEEQSTDTKTVYRHKLEKIEDLLPMLDNFIWDNNYTRMPKFIKEK